MRIGILGGTFDPIHNGHIYLAEKVLSGLSLEKIIFIPTRLTPHKPDKKISDAEHRYNMVKLTIEGNPRFLVSDLEIKRKGKSYSVQTLRDLRRQYGSSIELFFLAGSDCLKELDQWKDFDRILKLCKFVVIKRPGFTLESIPKTAMTLDIDAKDISSSGIRERIKEGKPVENLLPATVMDYIESHALYR